MANYNFRELLKETYDGLAARGYETSRADWLLEDLSGMRKSEILMNYNHAVPELLLHKFLACRERMYQGEPVQYIVGFADFYGRKFKVNKNVLIPRPETEELVLRILNARQFNQMTICDIGTGTGAIAISIKKENPELTVIATDISDKALSLAEWNAQSLDANITFYKGNALEPLVADNVKVDIIVSNPPYIALTEKVNMSDSVLDFEPHLALFAENNGLQIYQKILSDIDKVLTPGGLVLFEIGYQQGEILKEYIEQNYNVKNLQIIKDINNNNRMIQFNWLNE